MQLFRTTAVLYVVVAALVGSWVIVNELARLWQRVQAFLG